MKKYILYILVIILVLLQCACSHNTTGSLDSAQTSKSNGSASNQTTSQTEIPPELTIEEWVAPTDMQPSTWEELWTQPKPPKEIDAENNDMIYVDGTYPMPPITNAGTMYDLMSEVDILPVMSAIFNGSTHTTINPEYTHPSMALEMMRIPISFLRQTEEGCYYTVLKVTGGGYAYFFFERIKRLNEDGELAYVTEDLTKVTEIGCLYAEKVLQKSDFDVLKIGDTIEDVIAIDNAAVVTKQWNDMLVAREMESPHHASVSVHLLTDGLLTIEYTHKGTVYTIKSITYSEDFIFDPPLRDAEFGKYPKDYSILPQDYPPET